jgi:hypothetical protein
MHFRKCFYALGTLLPIMLVVPVPVLLCYGSVCHWHHLWVSGRSGRPGSAVGGRGPLGQPACGPWTRSLGPGRRRRLPVSGPVAITVSIGHQRSTTACEWARPGSPSLPGQAAAGAGLSSVGAGSGSVWLPLPLGTDESDNRAAGTGT